MVWKQQVVGSTAAERLTEAEPTEGAQLVTGASHVLMAW